MPQCKKLLCWKEIADYLGMNIRTAQNRDREYHFVIHPYKGKRYRVWAYKEELDHYKETHGCMIK